MSGVGTAVEARGPFAERIVTEVVISAPPERVWDILVDIARYPDWNPFIVEASGDLAVGGRLSVMIRPQGKPPARFTPEVVAFHPGRALIWRGTLPIPGLFVGEHAFELERRGDGGTTLIQSERFRGGLVWLIRALGVFTATQAGFHAMNAALKARAEAVDRTM